jgi:hypothetical protein
MKISKKSKKPVVRVRDKKLSMEVAWCSIQKRDSMITLSSCLISILFIHPSFKSITFVSPPLKGRLQRTLMAHSFKRKQCNSKEQKMMPQNLSQKKIPSKSLLVLLLLAMLSFRTSSGHSLKREGWLSSK